MLVYRNANISITCRCCCHCLTQVQYSQRNLPGNSQRKYAQTMHVPKGFSGDHEVTPSFPLELKDVQMLSVSPSGQHCLLSHTSHLSVHSSAAFCIPEFQVMLVQCQHGCNPPANILLLSMQCFTLDFLITWHQQQSIKSKMLTCISTIQVNVHLLCVPEVRVTAAA